MQRHHFIKFSAALLIASSISTAFAQARPGSIRFIVPYPPGGGADQVTRLVANEVSTIIGKPIIVENKAGASGMIGAEFVLRAEADGSIFYIGTNAPLVINQAIYEKMPYDPAKHFVGVAGLTKIPLLMVSRKDLNAKDLKTFIALSKSNDITMGSASSGNITHLAGENAAEKMGFKVTHIPFPGTAPAMTSLLGGNIDLLFDGIPGSLQHIKAGRITPLLYLDTQRASALPDVPTAKEMGYNGLEAAAWYGVMAKSGTPQSAIDEVNAAINKALTKPELADKLSSMHYQIMPGSPKDFEDFIHSERNVWIPLAKALNIRAD